MAVTFTTVTAEDMAGAVYMTSGIKENDVLDLMGWYDRTSVTVHKLDDDSVLYEGTLNNFETVDVDLNTDRVRVDASAPSRTRGETTSWTGPSTTPASMV